MILICYKCGHRTEVTEDESNGIYMRDEPFICSNEGCDSWQFFEMKDGTIDICGERKLICKKCNSTEFESCGDGDGMGLIGDLKACPCGNSRWIYHKFDNEEIREFKANRVKEYKKRKKELLDKSTYKLIKIGKS